jgi:hypothetical protein
MPIYDFVTDRIQLLRMADVVESRDRASDPEIGQKPDGIKAYWV